MASLPASLTYNSERPRGFPSDQQVTRFYPQNGLQAISNNDTVRINVRIPNGFWDPYSAYINIEADITGADDNSMQQIDSSAHSFFSGLVIWSNGVEIERINEYDVLANILIDMQLSSEGRYSHSYMGVGYSNETHRKEWTPPSQFRQNRTVFDFNTNQVTGGALVNIVGGPRTSASGSYPTTSQYTQMWSGQNITNIGLPSGTSASNIGVPMVVSHQPSFLKHAFKPFINYDVMQDVPPLDDVETSIRSCWSNCAYNVITQSVQDSLDTTNVYSTTGAVIGDNSLIGVSAPYSYSFANSAFEETFSTTIPTQSLRNGVPKFGIQTRSTYCVPILSGIFGCLMPKSSYRFIPIGAFGEVIFEFRMSPYAMFTSGYTDLWYVDGSRRQAKRNYRLNKLEIVAEICKFDNDVTQIIGSQLEQGVVLHTNSWWNCVNYNVAANSIPPTVSINVGFQSLKALFWSFYPTDYQRYSFCRKLYRICQSITGYQLRVGTSFIPSQPVKGNAGNVIPSNSSTNTQYGGFDNSEFVVQLHKAFGKFMDIKSTPFISQTNFAINDRYYDPAATEGIWPRTVTLNGNAWSVPFGPFWCNFRLNIGAQLPISTLYQSGLNISNVYDAQGGMIWGPYVSNLDLYYWVEIMQNYVALAVPNLPSTPPGVSTFVCLLAPFFATFDISGENTSTNGAIGQTSASGTNTNLFIYSADKFMDYNLVGHQGLYRNNKWLTLPSRVGTGTFTTNGASCPPNIGFQINAAPGNTTVTAPYTATTQPLNTFLDVTVVPTSLAADLNGPYISMDENLNVPHGYAVNRNNVQGVLTNIYTKMYRTVNPSNISTAISTAIGYPIFHENRCIGKALYGLDLESLDRETNVLSGINTTTTRPFDLLLEYDSSSGFFKRDSVMQVFGLFDMFVKISSAGIEVMGRS